MREILQALAQGGISLEAAEQALAQELDLGGVKLDLGRHRRTGMPEGIYGEAKSLEQLRQILTHLPPEAHPLVTRLQPEKGAALALEFPALHWHPEAGILKGNPQETRFAKAVALLSAGSSDLRVAEEAALSASHLGAEVKRVYDVGVAGIHRLTSRLDEVKACGVAIVVAGMDGALPSLVGGLVGLPVIAVPTSVGYGVSFQGLAPLLAMLNACSSGVTVVNIDNGYGAAMAAIRILRGLA